ncbi:flippase [Deltaproteobacteria bacterium TL4]
MINKFQKFTNHQGVKKYFKNTSWMFGEQILRMLAGLFVGVWVARYLGPEQFGILNYVIAFTAIFGSIARLGLDGIVVRDLVNDPSRRDIYLGTAFWLKVIGSIVIFGVIVAVTLFTSDDTTTNLYIFIIASGMIFQSFEVIEFYFQAKVLSKFVSLCRIAQLLLSSILKIYFVVTGTDIFWFVLVSLLDQVSLAISLLLAYYAQKLGGFYKNFDVWEAKRLLKDSWPLVTTSLFIMIYIRIDQVMIKNILGEMDVGIYSAAVRLSEVFYFIPVIIANSLFPAILETKKRSRILYLARLQMFYTLMVWIAIGIGLIMTLMSDHVVTLLYGKAYKSAGLVLKVHIWATVFVFFGTVKGKWILTENMQFYSAICTGLGAVSNIVFNMVLIPHYGVVGASMATIFAHIFSALVIPTFYKPDRISVLMLLNTFNLKQMRKNVTLSIAKKIG